MRLRSLATMLILCLPFAPQALAQQSVYTVLDIEDSRCKQLGDPPTEVDIDLGVVSLLCPGYKDYPVEYNAGDDRTSVHFGDPAKTTTETVWESFLPFNSAGDKVEWRVDGDGKPYAAILRFHVNVGDPEAAIPEPRSQVLVISKVGQPGGPAGCVVGLIDALANKNANELARQIADRVTGFTCGKDKAGYFARRGEKMADFLAGF